MRNVLDVGQEMRMAYRSWGIDHGSLPWLNFLRYDKTDWWAMNNDPSSMNPESMNALKNFIQQKVSLHENEWSEFESVLQTKHLKKKQHFLQEGQICKQIGFIVSGYVRLYYLKDGEEITKDFNFENMFCGSYASFSLQQPSLFYIIAMEDVELITFARDDLYRLADTHVSIERMLRKNMEFMFIRKELREASFLLDDAPERYRKLLEQEPAMIRRVPLKYLASYLGMSAETLSRVRALI